MIRSKLVAELFNALFLSRVPFMVLSSFEHIDGTHGDIDLYVPHEQQNNFLRVLRDKGWYGRREPSSYTFKSFYYKVEPPQLIALDVKFSLLFGSEPNTLLEAWEPERIVREAVCESDGYLRPRGTDLLLLYLAHVTHEKKMFTQRHLQILQRYAELYKSEVPSGDAMYQALVHLAEISDIGASRIAAEELLRKVFIDLGPSQRFSRKGRRSVEEFRILFLGADGSGKTTVIDALRQKLNVKTSKLYLGEHDWAIPLIGHLYHKILSKTLRLPIIFLFYPLDLLLRRMGTRQGGIRVVLIDRIPGFPFISGGTLAAIYRAAIGRIDFIVHLTGDPETMYGRKREGTLGKTRYNIEKWDQVVRFWAVPHLTIDTTEKTLDETITYCLNAISSDDRFQKTFFKKINIA